jgi:hypothetical protein
VGLAFTLDIVPSRNGARYEAVARLLAVAGLGLSAWYLASGPTAALGDPEWLRGLVALLLGSVAAWVAWPVPGRLAGRTASGRGAGRKEAGGVGASERLVVDDAGACSLESPDRGIEPATLRQASILPGLILVSLAPCDPALTRERAGRSSIRAVFGRHWRTRTLSFGRDAVPCETWRRLGVWLAWRGRGRRDRPPVWKTR